MSQNYKMTHILVLVLEKTYLTRREESYSVLNDLVHLQILTSLVHKIYIFLLLHHDYIPYLICELDEVDT
jgi:predicted nucleic-acid-binding protein